VVRRYFEDVLGGGRLDLLNELVAPVYVDHTAQPGRSPGIAGIREVTHMFRTAFPDLTVTVEDCLADADRVATRFTLRGTHTGPFADMAPTGRRVTIGGMAITRLAGGLIAEQWDQADMLGLLRQLGVFPPASTPRSIVHPRRSDDAEKHLGQAQNRTIGASPESPQHMSPHAPSRQGVCGERPTGADRRKWWRGVDR
jgi:predicted ester cyclase